MTEIEYTSLSSVVGCYDTEMDIIFINKKLKQNKRVHDMVLRHELLHAKAKKNMLKHLYIDLTDNFKYLFDKEAMALTDACDTTGIMDTYLTWIGQFIVIIVLSPFALIAQLYFLYLDIIDIFRRKKSITHL